jgi:hypothetical protein
MSEDPPDARHGLKEIRTDKLGYTIGVTNRQLYQKINGPAYQEETNGDVTPALAQDPRQCQNTLYPLRSENRGLG